jgi:ankyrin repeat protein
VRHAQFEDVASRIKGMEDLFDPDQPYFAAWGQFHDIDTLPPFRSAFYQFSEPSKSGANTPLYCAALCGFPNIVEQLIAKHPQHVNAVGGYYRTPAVAALAGRHFQLAELLHRNGSSVDPPGRFGISTLHSAVSAEDVEMVQVLLDYGVDVNARNNYDSTPLNFAYDGRFKDPRVVRLLLDYGADPNIRRKDNKTPLHFASRHGRIEVARLLVEHGASVEAKDHGGLTPLDFASEEQRDENDSIVEMGDDEGNTSLDYASEEQRDEMIKLLSEYLAK